MTNTDTADIDATVKQVAQLWRAGSELVRITVDRDEAAAAVPHIRDKLAQRGVNVPLVGDFHYIGHKLLTDHPACAEALAKYRINPGNVGFKAKRDTQFATLIELAIKYDKPVRIGVNWGSLDEELLTRLMDENSASANPVRAAAVQREAIIQSALLSAQRAPKRSGSGATRSSSRPRCRDVQHLIAVYQDLAARCDYALHLGLTEAGMGSKGIVASSAAMGILLQQGIGDTIRVSLTPEPGGDRTQEVRVAQELLQTMGFRQFLPVVAACPGCGRTTSQTFQVLAKEIQDHLIDFDARVEGTLSRRRDAVGRGDGLHRQRPGRKQARQYRHLAARHRRNPGGAGVRRWPEGRDPARRRCRRAVQGDGRRLYREEVRRRQSGSGVRALVPLIIAHRGYSARYRENAPSSWQAAVAAGVDLVEVDVRMTADGVLVCCA